MKALGVISVALALTAGLAAQEPSAPVKPLTVEPGTRIPLQLINRISSKNAQPGDQVYLQTAYPIVVDGHVVIPPGSYVRGTITQVKRPGRVAGRGELYLRFDSLTLSNGVTRDFLGRIGSVDGSNSETLDKKEGKVLSDTNKGKDAATVAATTATGTSIGAIAGSASRHPGLGTGIGAAAGAAAGIATILLTRGPEAILERGSTVDMILDRPLMFREAELPTANMSPVPIVPPPAQLNNSRLPMGIPR